MSAFSTNGVLSVVFSGIPATAALASVILYHKRIHMCSSSVKLFILILIFLPYYYAIAWSDWKSTWFDVFPEKADVTIEKGFGKGLRTNNVYYNLYEWVTITSEKYTKKGDFMISYVVSPMTHMIAKLRPSLDYSWISLHNIPFETLDKSITLMKKRGRFPKIAFVFESMPALYPISLKGDRYAWLGKQFTFPSSQDPLSRYIRGNMTFVDAFKLYKGNFVRCFVDNEAINSKALAP
jgi:hypothetical protein